MSIVTDTPNDLESPETGSLHEQGTDAGYTELRYRRVCSEVANTAWALYAPTLAVLVDLLSYRAHGHRITAEEVAERIGARRPREARNTSGGVAVLALSGVIAHRASAFESVSSPNGTSVEAFTRAFREVMADPEVGSIMLEIDSPGGSVDGVPEIAAEIRRTRGRKPIVAFANTMAASAAYWIAAQADEVVVAPSGQVGSIGVYAAHQDLSAQLEQDGVKVTLISAGPFKTEGNPFEPLTEEARANWQATVDMFYGQFLGAVAKGRGVPLAQVRDGFGQGRMVFGQDAVAAGMADRVDTFENTVTRLQRGEVPASHPRADLGGVIAIASEEFPGGATTASEEEHEPAEPELVEVDGAHALLGRKAVRDAFAPDGTSNEGSQ